MEYRVDRHALDELIARPVEPFELLSIAKLLADIPPEASPVWST